VSLLGVDEVRELERVTDKEDGGVVPRHIVVAVLGVELDGESARVPLRVRRASFSADGREPGEDLRLLAYPGEEPGFGVPGDIGGDLEVAVGAASLGVDDALRDTLPVEVAELFQQVNVLSR
jgi:hypothetical protein